MLTQGEVERFLYREARALDDKEWDDWLAFYAADAVFWMPSWDDDDRLVDNPMTDISLIYYGHKGGLEDRVFRIRTERSSATSLPEPRTSHNISNVEVTAQSSPHFAIASKLLNSLACEMALAKAVMSGASRCSGMLGMSS